MIKLILFVYLHKIVGMKENLFFILRSPPRQSYDEFPWRVCSLKLGQNSNDVKVPWT